MDVDLLRTFTTIVDSGHFIRAAERLNVTQSTVSGRIKELELRLGRTLLIRGKAGTTLTPAGQRFLPHAISMLRAWQQAVQEVALPPDVRTVLSVGGQYSLWDRVLLRWMAWMRHAEPQVALRAEVNPSDELSRMLMEGALDIAVLYTPKARQGLNIEFLMEERLVLVAADGGRKEQGPGSPGYVLVDWGEEFRSEHAAAFADEPTPTVAIGLGAVALNFILEDGGSAYFPLRMVRRHVESGQLRRIEDAPEFARPAFVVWQSREDSILDNAVRGLRPIAAAESG